MDKIDVRKVTAAEIGRLLAISRITFQEAFSEQNTPEDIEAYLRASFSTAKLSDELATPESAFYFALLRGNVIGYLKVNRGEAQTALKDSDGMEIERIYVLRSYHGKKIGQLLLDKALSIAKKLQRRFIWLGVWENNLQAIRFYRKNGFREFDKHCFMLGNDPQTDILMRLELSESSPMPADGLNIRP